MIAKINFCFLQLRKKEFVQASASGSESSVVNSVDEEGQAGSIFWFSIPITLPLSVHMKKETFDKNQVEDEEKQFQTNEVEEIKTDVADVADVVMTDANTAEVIKRGLKRNLSSRSTGSPDNMVVQINSTIPKTHDKINLGASERKGRSDKKALIAYAETVSCCTESIVNSNQSNNCDCSEGSGKPKKKALVIDDSLTIRKGIVRALSKLGLEAQQAKNGFEGLQRLKSNCYDFVLCDFLMPVMDGLDCVQQYRDWEALHRSWFRQVRGTKPCKLNYDFFFSHRFILFFSIFCSILLEYLLMPHLMTQKQVFVLVWMVITRNLWH